MSNIKLFEKARQALIEASSYDEVKDIRDTAIAMQAYAEQAKDTTLEINAARIKLRAERRAGEMLAGMEKAKGAEGNPGGRGASIVRCNDVTAQPPTLSEIGITKRQSSDWQGLAKMDEASFEAELEKNDTPRTSTVLHRKISKHERKQKHSEMPKVQIPEGEYDVIYADPPWRYNDKCEDGAIQSGGAEKHYPTMSIQELCDMEVPAADNAVLFLWVTSPLLEECFAVIKAWRFKYKASFVWDKVKHNMGHYNSVRHEFLLICTKGSKTPEHVKLFDSVQSIERTKHSTKPEEFRDIIETLYPSGKKLELFARKTTDGWTTYGNETV